MKQSILLKGLFLFLIIAGIGCANTCDSTCDLIFPEVSFKIVNGADENLIAGPNKIYTSNRIKIKSLIGNNLTDATIFYVGDSTQASGAINFSASSLSDTYFLYVDDVKTDSFQVTYQSFEGKSDCCPAYNTITSLKLNNVSTNYVFPGNSTPVKVVQ